MSSQLRKTVKTATKKNAKATEEEEEETYLNYIVNIYDNHGTINITQTGSPIPPPPPPPTE